MADKILLAGAGDVLSTLIARELAMSEVSMTTALVDLNALEEGRNYPRKEPIVINSISRYAEPFKADYIKPKHHNKSQKVTSKSKRRQQKQSRKTNRS